tara:strand:+ start:1620 stop:5849 length:4230 start_codon:yes stop_codon:yes gene_type:complete
MVKIVHAKRAFCSLQPKEEKKPMKTFFALIIITLVSGCKPDINFIDTTLSIKTSCLEQVHKCGKVETNTPLCITFAAAEKEIALTGQLKCENEKCEASILEETHLDVEVAGKDLELNIFLMREPMVDCKGFLKDPTCTGLCFGKLHDLGKELDLRNGEGRCNIEMVETEDEVCSDNIDNNCDGRIDENCVETGTVCPELHATVLTDEACGQNGLRSLVCESGLWREDICIEQESPMLECIPNETENGMCGTTNTGTRNRICEDNGFWGEWSECSFNGECQNEGDIRPVACTQTHGPNSTKQEICLEGVWHTQEECVCTENFITTFTCTNLGMATQVCNEDGTLGNIVCPDECFNGNSMDCYSGQENTLNVGLCLAGTKTCTNGHYGNCVGEELPQPEICDGLDNDCDGNIDEQAINIPNIQCFEGIGACRNAGSYVCQDGNVICNAVASMAQQEICDDDFSDEDCDGLQNEDCQCNPDGFPRPGQNCGIGACQAQGVITCEGGMIMNSCVENESSEEDNNCDLIDNDCDGVLDEDFEPTVTACGIGECRREGNTRCINGEEEDVCVPHLPQREICDGLDNDCDNQVDEDLGLGDVCSVGVGECGNTGTFVCGNNGDVVCNASPREPQVEVCDGLDNDCDRFVDEDSTDMIIGTACDMSEEHVLGECARNRGTYMCTVGGEITCIGGNTPRAEQCNRLDDDCDGNVDEDFPGLGDECFAGLGLCERSGSIECSQDGLTASCTATPRNPLSIEQCGNNQDDDCNGLVDEGEECVCMDGQEVECGSNIGSCLLGTQTCQFGQYGECLGGVQPVDETCNGEDDDCDEAVDEGFNVGNGCNIGQGVCFSEGVVTCEGCNAHIIEPNDEICNGLDDDCDGTVDENPTDPTIGEDCGPELGVCGSDRGSLVCSNAEIICEGGVQPEDEVCNGLDDDCDGDTDELFVLLGTPCSAGVGQCQRNGVYVCSEDGNDTRCNAVAGQPQNETCNRLDDNCDGNVDEIQCNCSNGDTQPCGSNVGACQQGVETCTNGQWGECVNEVSPVEEACNALDDDCDGLTDEDFTLGEVCTVGLGICINSGVTQCRQDETDSECSVQPLPPQNEICDDLDNDCDGTVDNNVAAECECDNGNTRPCGSNVGACQQGVETCINGQWDGECDGEIVPVIETCNGLDDNCDGNTDESFNLGNPCSVGLGICQRSSNLVCSPDQSASECDIEPGNPVDEVCDDELDNDCDGFTDGDDDDCGCVPQAEVCDGVDNDCDGIIDNFTTTINDHTIWWCSDEVEVGGLFYERGYAEIMHNFAQAQTYCAEQGKRLPTINELRMIIRGCPQTETGGSCPVTDQNPNGNLNECGGCARRNGDANFGLYFQANTWEHTIYRSKAFSSTVTNNGNVLVLDMARGSIGALRATEREVQICVR